MRNAIWRCSVATHTSNLISAAALCATVSGCRAHTSPTRARLGCHLTERICKYTRRALRRDPTCAAFPFPNPPVWLRHGAASCQRVNGLSRRAPGAAQTTKDRLRKLSITHHGSQSCRGLLSVAVDVTLRIKSLFNHRIPMSQPFPTARSGLILTR